LLSKQINSVDAFIVGGGPSGLAAALSLLRKGLSVVVADAAQPTIDKACGEGLMPDAVASLAHLGIQIPKGVGAFFHGICFRNAQTAASAYFTHGIGIGVRRTVLHQLLLDHVTALGATLLWGTRVDLLGEGMLAANGEQWQPRWIIGADGQRSRVRQFAGLDHGPSKQRFGFRQHFQVAPWTDCVEVYWANGGQAYVTPTRANEVCVALITEDKHFRFADIANLFPDLAAQLHGHPPNTKERGAVTICRSLPHVTQKNIALVGEASGSVDAITGEGLALSFQQAIALGEAIAAGDLALYEKRHRQISLMTTRMSQALVFMGRHPYLQARILRAFHADASVFSHMLAVHLGFRSPSAITAGSICKFGWNLVTA
jgi:flavin-dependent dehydrogenase